MAADPNDLFAEFRTGGAQSAPREPANPDVVRKPAETTQEQDIFAEFRTGPTGDGPNIRREDNTLGEEFVAGLGGGIEGMQGSLFGVAGLAGRELGIDWLEKAGNEGAARNFEDAADQGRQAQGFSDIEDAGGFFKWTAASLGEAIPSLATAMTGAGIGAAIGRKSVELGVKKSVARRVERDLRSRMGFTTAEALTSTRGLMNTKQGQDMVRDAFLKGNRVIAPALAKAGKVGGTAGAVAVASLPQIGAIDQELLSSGVVDPGLTALIGGIAGGALEAVPALRLLDKMFPGVDKQVSKAFVKDFAVSTGTQFALEGSTEAAQEIIQLAALAYHDPTFDMFSPDARRRVVDAFAAGALVGAVTGGGAEVIGGVQTGAFTGARESVKRAKAAVPIIGAWSMTARDKAGEVVEGALPEGFVPADKTVFEEIRHRVYSSVQPHIEQAVNSLQGQVDKVSQSLNDNLEGGVNAESATLSEIAKAAHKKFLEEHGDQIDQAKAYMDTQIERIAKTAKEIQDPQQRAAFIEEHVQATKEKLAGFVDMLRRKAAARDSQTEAEVDNMDFDESMIENLGFEVEQEETERRVGPSGRKFDRSVGPEATQESPLIQPAQPAAGETEAAPVLTFGKNQLSPKVGVDGKETVVAYDTKAQAKLGRSKLRTRFPEVKNQDNAFRIVKNPDGKGWIIEVISPEVMESQKFFNDLDSARASAARTKNTARNNERKIKLPVDGTKFGYKFKNLFVDLKTLAFKGRNLDPNAKTLEDGFLAMSTEMVARKMITVEQFNEMNEKFQKHFGETAQNEFDEFAAPGKFPTVGVAKANMINFINKMKERGIPMPFNLLNAIENDDGTFSWGVDDVRAFRALRAKSPQDAATILSEIKNERRQDQLAEAAQKEGEFSQNATGVQAGDLGDTRGNTAGAARVASDPIRTGRAGGKRTAGIDVRSQTATATSEDSQTPADSGPQGDFADTTGAFPSGDPRRNQRVQRKLEDTDPQSDDQKTDPKNQPPEFSDRSDPSVRNRKRRANQNAQELSAHDQKLLKRWGRPGSVKIMLGPNVDAAVQSALTTLANFVTKTLGLNNQITVVDNDGLQLLIDNGAVSDPIFQQTINDPGVHARNIRIGDNSFVYLSPKILSDPVATTLAFGHEMGHHVYRVAWDKLTPAAQANLRKAFGKGTDAEFNEWMADQLAAWIVKPRLAQGAADRFFAKVAAQIRKLYDFVSKNERFQLNETFEQFADAVALKAKSATSQESNPYNDAQIKAWFRNDGVTMYQWFGDVLEQDNMDFSPATQQGKDALARMESKYPAIVKRAVTLRNWVVAAYKMTIAPSTSAVRDIALRIKSANKLVTIFNREAHGNKKIQQNYHQAVELMRGQFMDKFTQITKGIEATIKTTRPNVKGKELQTLINAKMREIGQSLSKKDGDPGATFTAEEQAVRDLFDQMHEYATESGLPVRHVVNYFPRSLSRELLIANKQKILDHLTDGKNMPLARARHLYNSLIDPNANDGRATFDVTETPGFTAMNSRQVQDKFFDQFLDDNTQGIVGNYVNQVVKRAEFNRKLGEPMPVTELDAKEAIQKGIWDPKRKMHKILADAKNEGATDADLVILEKYIDANLGQLGRDDIKPGMRKFMAGVMAYQNMRVLLFTVFASLPDLAGPAIRNGSMKDTWKVLKNNIGEMAKQDSGLAEMAHALGIVQDSVSDNIFTEYVDNNYMPAKLRKWNDNFFEYTGLNWYTNFTRKYALAVGIDYIEQSYNNFVSGATAQAQARGKDMLAELGMTPAQAKRWIAAGKPTYDSQSHEMDGDERAAAEALIQFVDESIMRPNASQRPIMASHPGAMLVYHLKGYMYAVHDIILKRIKFNIDESESPAQYAAAIAPAIAMMLLTAVGLELRELIQYAGSNRKPPTDRMDGWEYTWELAQRSGLTGFAQIGVDLQGAEDRGMSHVAGIGGPALSQAADIISKPSTQTIPKAIPIIGQIPAAREIVRNQIN